MHKHFDKHLNLKSFILATKPKVIVECGAGLGENTKLLASLADEYDFQLDVINDRKIEGMDPAINWHIGLSYKVLKAYPDESIGLCIIDTDHNYWTLMNELNVVGPKMVERGLVAMHDIETFYHDTGLALSYFNGDPYPQEEIEEIGKTKGSMGDALMTYLALNSHHFKLVGYTDQSHGAAIIQKYTLKYATFYMPGQQPIYAQKLEELVASR